MMSSVSSYLSAVFKCLDLETQVQDSNVKTNDLGENTVSRRLETKTLSQDSHYCFVLLQNILDIKPINYA